MTSVLSAYQFYLKVWPCQNQELEGILTHSCAYAEDSRSHGQEKPKWLHFGLSWFTEKWGNSLHPNCPQVTSLESHLLLPLMVLCVLCFPLPTLAPWKLNQSLSAHLLTKGVCPLTQQMEFNPCILESKRKMSSAKDPIYRKFGMLTKIFWWKSDGCSSLSHSSQSTNPLRGFVFWEESHLCTNFQKGWLSGRPERRILSHLTR